MLLPPLHVHITVKGLLHLYHIAITMLSSLQCQELAENLKRTEALAHSSVEENLWIISCMFTKDENSFLESVSLSLLDWQHVQK